MVTPAPRPNDQLLAWAANIVEREQKNRIYGTVTIRMEDGVITGVKVEKNEKPAFTHPPDQ